MRRFSIRPSLTVRGRKFKGLRGFAGKPFHPPLTDFPIAAYVFAAVLDVVSTIGRHDAWARDFFRAATFVLIGGAAVSVLAALTGFWDWWRSSEAGTQARRTINTHATIMITVTLIALGAIAAHLVDYHVRTHPSPLALALSLAAGVLVSVGATFGGSLVYDYGFNVETAGDHPAWHVAETDVLPGAH